MPWFLLTFFLELSYIFFFAHLIMRKFTWMLDVTCGRTVETDGCGKVDPSLYQAIAVGTTQRIAGLMLSFQRCDCERGPWLVRGCWDGAVSLWLSAPWAALSHLCAASGERAVHLLKAPCMGCGWWASSPRPVSALESLLPFLCTHRVPGQACRGEARPASDARLTGLGRAICV